MFSEQVCEFVLDLFSVAGASSFAFFAQLRSAFHQQRFCDNIRII